MVTHLAKPAWRGPACTDGSTFPPSRDPPDRHAVLLKSTKRSLCCKSQSCTLKLDSKCGPCIPDALSTQHSTRARIRSFCSYRLSLTRLERTVKLDCESPSAITPAILSSPGVYNVYNIIDGNRRLGDVRGCEEQVFSKRTVKELGFPYRKRQGVATEDSPSTTFRTPRGARLKIRR